MWSWWEKCGIWKPSEQPSPWRKQDILSLPHYILPTPRKRSIGSTSDVFPSHQQQQVRIQLSSVLKAVVCQTLIPKLNAKGRIAAREIMIVTFLRVALGILIREGKSHQIYGAIDTGVRVGMISLDRALADLVKRGLISTEEALAKANRPGTLLKGVLLRPHGGLTHFYVERYYYQHSKRLFQGFSALSDKTLCLSSSFRLLPCESFGPEKRSFVRASPHPSASESAFR